METKVKPKISNPHQDSIRQQIQNQRRKFKNESVLQFESESQTAIQNWVKVISEGTPARALHILAYLPLLSELSLTSFFNWASEHGHSLYLPRVAASSTGQSELEVCGPFESIAEWLEPDFVRSPLGVWEPSLATPAVAPSVLKSLDYVLVPGVAFTAQGHRIGLGKGFYDRLLVALTGITRVSFAFDFQVIEAGFEINSWDQKVDWLITPKRQFGGPKGNVVQAL